MRRRTSCCSTSRARSPGNESDPPRGACSPSIAEQLPRYSPAHLGGVVHSSPSFSGASRNFAPPPGPLFQGSSARHPSSPIGRTGHWPSWDEGRHPDNHRHGVGSRGPYLYVGYPWLSPFGYGLPYGLPYGDDQDEGGGAQAAPQQPDYSNQPTGDYGPEPPEVAANTPSPFRPAYEGPIEFAPVHRSAHHHLDLQGWAAAGEGA